jgi:hypothetical protein
MAAAICGMVVVILWWRRNGQHLKATWARSAYGPMLVFFVLLLAPAAGHSLRERLPLSAGMAGAYAMFVYRRRR